ncbi:MAG: GntR family transcriptional regulator, partial [Terrimicrobiaceae bacterium]
MNFGKYKSQNLAVHLRAEIAQGAYTEPLPSLREWSLRLEVSPGTLQAALKILKGEGVIASFPRKGFCLTRKRETSLQHPPVVRWIFYDPKHRHMPPSPDIMMPISLRLAHHHIGFTMEWSNDAKMRSLYEAGANSQEMLVFLNSSIAQQQLFSGFRSALLIGYPYEGIPMPYITNDVFPAIRHATFLLARKGFKQIAL